MPSFTLEHCNPRNAASGLIKIFQRAIQAAAKISETAMLEFNDNELILFAQADKHAVIFRFSSEKFFTEYHCERKQKCYINVKSLHAPFKAPFISEKYASGGTMKANSGASDQQPPKITCELTLASEPHGRRNPHEINYDDKLVFIITTANSSESGEYVDKLQYNLNIKHHDENSRDRHGLAHFIPSDDCRLMLRPRCSNNEKFLMTGLNSFADCAIVVIKAEEQRITFQGICDNEFGASSISEFSHKLTDFNDYKCAEPISIQMPLKQLKLFVSNIENCRGLTSSTCRFERNDRAHFLYEFDTYMKAQYTTTTSRYEAGPESLLAIESMNPDEIIGSAGDFLANGSSTESDDAGYRDEVDYDGDEDDCVTDGYQANESDEDQVQFMDEDSSQLDGPLNGHGVPAISYTANSIVSVGRESLMRGSEGPKLEPMPQEIAMELFRIGNDDEEDEEDDEDEIENYIVGPQSVSNQHNQNTIYQGADDTFDDDLDDLDN